MFLLLCLQRWLNVVLDLLIACLAVGLIWLAVALRGTTSGAEIGIALNVIILVNATLLNLVSHWTNMEIALGGVARLKDAEETTPREEEPQEPQPLGEDWPSAGGVELVNVSAAYRFVLCRLAEDLADRPQLQCRGPPACHPGDNTRRDSRDLRPDGEVSTATQSTRLPHVLTGLRSPVERAPSSRPYSGCSTSPTAASK